MTLRPRARRTGFTLIELLIVVVIIGILAAIAIPKFSNTKGKAFMATMRSDLRNLMVAQLDYRSEQTPPTYADNIALLGTRFTPSTGVTIPIVQGDGMGFAATARHTGLGDVVCAIFRGNASAPPATTEGEVVCQ